jgi:hypothetical protein
LHVASNIYCGGLIDPITSPTDDPGVGVGDAFAAAIGRALSELDASDRAALEAAIPALARLADAIARLPT